jgi:hypothetical protein
VLHRPVSAVGFHVLRTPLAIAAALLLALGAGADAAQAEDADPAVTWSVQPADASGPDGRAWVEQSLDPGDAAVEHLAVHNFSDREVAFRLTAADGFFNENGRFNILPSDQNSVAAGTWIDLPETVTVGPAATAVVPFTITVPDEAEPGDHAAGVAASIMSTSTGDGATVGVESRVGFRVMTRVTGDLKPSAEIAAITTDYRTSWNPFSPGTLTVDFDVVNTGNTRLRITGVVEAGGRQVSYPPEAEPQELLVGDTRHFSVVVDEVWPTFAVPVSVRATPEVIVVGGEAPELAPLQAEATAWAIPWPQILVVAGIALLVGALVWGRLRSRRRLESLLADAREEGRRDAAVSEPR